MSGHPVPGERTGLARVLPIFAWAPRYKRAFLRPDLIAGITVAALVVPKSLGCAGIAGVPVGYGLYAAAAGAILYGLFGLSGQVTDVLEADGVLDRLGASNVYQDVCEAVAELIPDDTDERATTTR